MSSLYTTLGELAELVGARLIGEPGTRVDGVSTLRRAGPTQVCFCSSDRYADELATTRAAAVIVDEGRAEKCPVAALVVKNPYHAYATVAQRLQPPRRPAPGIHPSASVAESARVAPDVHVGPNASIGPGARIATGVEIGAGAVVEEGAMIGPQCRLYPGVFIGAGCLLRRRVIVHAGVVIGADGFGFAPGADGWKKVPQLGVVRIGSDVEIGANSTIDRGALDDTVIGEGVKIDNLVHIAHNVRIGAHTVIAGATVVAGSVTIGRNCMIGGASAITGHIEITDGVTVMGMTGVTRSIRKRGVYASPIPAHPAPQWRRNAVRFMQLDEMYRRLQELERRFERANAEVEAPRMSRRAL